MNVVTPELPRLLKIRELAATLQVSVRTVQTHVAAGRLPRPLRIGRAVRWLPTEVSEAIKAMAAAR